MIALPAIFFAAFVSWAYAAYSAVKLAAHRKPHVPMSKLIMSGMAWFNKDNFTQEGEPHRKAFLTAFVAFFVCVLVLMLLVMMQAPSLTPQYEFKPQ